MLTIKNVMWYYLHYFGMLKFNLTSYHHHRSHFCCHLCFCHFFCLNRDILLEILRRELMSESLLWKESRRWWIQIKKTILVDVLPSFLLMIKHSPVIKVNQEGWILLFRLPISLIPPFYTLSILKWSERHFRGVVFGLSQRKKYPC